jgi:hypothetical protein
MTHQRPARAAAAGAVAPHGAVEVVVEGLVVGVALAEEALLALGRVLEAVGQEADG